MIELMNESVDEQHGYGEQLCCEKCGWYQHVTEGKCVNKDCQASRKYLSIPMEDWHEDTWNGDKSEIGQQIQGTKAEIESDSGLGTPTTDGLHPYGWSVIQERHAMLMNHTKDCHEHNNGKGRKNMCKVCAYHLPYECSYQRICRCAKCIFANAHGSMDKMLNDVFYSEFDKEIIGKEHQKNPAFVTIDSLDDEEVYEQWKVADKKSKMKITIYDDRLEEFEKKRDIALKNKEAKDIREQREQHWVDSGHKRSELIPEKRKYWFNVWTKKYSKIIENAFSQKIVLPDNISEREVANFTWALKQSNGDQGVIIATVAKYIIPHLKEPIEEDPWADKNMVCGLKGCNKIRVPKELSCIQNPINFKSLTTYDEMIDKKETMRKEMEDKDREQMEIIRQTYWSKTE